MVMVVVGMVVVVVVEVVPTITPVAFDHMTTTPLVFIPRVL